MRNGLLIAAVSAAIAIAGGRLSSQAQPDRVDFARDVQPILRQNCVGCHGPTVQQSRLRLDRRADAMRGGNIWKKEYAGMLPSEARELKQLRDENLKLNRLVADLSEEN